MEKVSIIIPVYNRYEMTERCINHLREQNPDKSFETIVVDNGSTDKTEEMLSGEKIITHIRNTENLGISKAYNRAADRAKHDILIFMHNDVFLFKKNWVAEIADFIEKNPSSGVVGLYGAKTLRRDGSFRGKTIVHSKKDFPSMKKTHERVAVVDGLLMAMNKEVFKKAGGFNEDFFFHFYDKDLSLRIMKRGYQNYILSIPFEHVSGATRKNLDADWKIRKDAQEIFVKIWRKNLPVDVRTLTERISYIFRKKA